MLTSYRRALERGFYPFAVLATVLTLLVAATIVGPASAIKGGYVLLGLCIAYVLSKSTTVRPRAFEPTAPGSVGGVSPGGLTKLVVIAWLAAVGVTLLTGNRLYGLLIGLPLGYVVLGIQLTQGQSSRSLLFQICLLFTLGPLTKYLTTGFYFGDTDIFAHVRLVDDLLATGSVAALSRYESFPGYHLFMGTVGTVTGLPTYDAILLSQILLYVVLILAMFLIVRTATDDAMIASVVALATTLVFYASFFVTIGFPQTVATLFVILLLYTAFRDLDPNIHGRLFLLGLVLGAGLILTHHLTILLFMPLILSLVVIQYLLRRLPEGFVKGNRPIVLRSFVLFVPGAAAVSYWLYDRRFLLEISYFFWTVFVEGLYVTEDELAQSTFAFGQQLPPIRIETSFYSLFSPEGIYFVLLVGTFVVGVRRLLLSPLEYPSLLGFCVIGLASALLVFPTPLAAHFDRIRLPLSLFFAIVLALGIVSVIQGTDRRRTLGVLLVLLVLLGTLTPIIAGDDLYGVHEGENLYEQRPLPQPDRDLTTDEYEQLERIAGLSQTNDRGAASLSTTHRAFLLFGGDEPAGDAVLVSENGFETDHELFVYRDRWTDHRMPQTYWDQQLTVTMSEEWLEQTISTENNVYTARDTGVLWREDGGVFGENAIQAVDAE